jgi:nucleotide-binding universal stress UspA family protein
MKKILVAIDFSKQSEYAAQLAAKIAKKTKSKVYLLHIIEIPKGDTDRASKGNFSIPESVMYIEKVKEKIEKIKTLFFDPSTVVKYSIRFETPHKGIIKYSTKIKADVIMMGSKGASDFKELLIGSNTEKVVRNSKIPVLVVKNEIIDFDIKKIVFASNFKEENKKTFAMLLAVAATLESSIHILKVNTINAFENTNTSKEKIATFLKEFELPEHTINMYNDTSVQKGILNFAKEIDADLIALSTYGRSGLSRLLKASVSKNLTKNAIKPVITFKV